MGLSYKELGWCYLGAWVVLPWSLGGASLELGWCFLLRTLLIICKVSHMQQIIR